MMTKSKVIDLSKFGLDPMADVEYDKDTGEVERIYCYINEARVPLEYAHTAFKVIISAHLAQEITDRKAKESDNG